MHFVRLLPLSLLLAAVLPQEAFARVLVVDARGGSGVDFTDIPPAVAAAADGDLIVVRAGWYTGFDCSKAISIVGEPNAVIGNGGPTYAGVRVSGIPAGRVFAISGMDVRVLGPGGVNSIATCAGTVLFERCSFYGPIFATDAADLRMTAVTSQGVQLTRSTATFDRCTFQGFLVSPFSGGVGIHASDSTFVASRCSLRGTVGPLGAAPGPAILLANGRAVVTGDGSGILRAGSDGTTPVAAVGGTGHLDIDPHVRAQGTSGGPVAEPGVNVAVRPIPSLRADGDALGGTVHVELFSPPGDLVYVFVGLPAPPVELPALQGAVWLRAPIPVVQGVQGASMRTNYQVPVPSSAALGGLVFTWQAVGGPPSGPLALSNACSYVHDL